MSEKILGESTTEMDLIETTPPPHKETTWDPHYKEPQISIHPLLGISYPKTLNMVGYVKKGDCFN